MDEIIPNLWVGSLGDAISERKKILIDVRWPNEIQLQPYTNRVGVAIPTTYPVYDSDKDVRTIEASPFAMVIVADLIKEHIKHMPILVHCVIGVDRSPLTVACYLVRHHGLSLNDAYKLVETMHPETHRHEDWLPHYWKKFIEGRRYDHQLAIDQFGSERESNP